MVGRINCSKGDLLTETGDVMQAETSLEKAIEKYPMDAELRSIVATRRIAEGRIEVAQALLDNTPATIDHPELHIVEGASISLVLIAFVMVRERLTKSYLGQHQIV